jgi:hypothetical protein
VGGGGGGVACSFAGALDWVLKECWDSWAGEKSRHAREERGAEGMEAREGKGSRAEFGEMVGKEGGGEGGGCGGAVAVGGRQEAAFEEGRRGNAGGGIFSI